MIQHAKSLAVHRPWSPAKSIAVDRVERLMGSFPVATLTKPFLVSWATSGRVAPSTAYHTLVTLAGILRDAQLLDVPGADPMPARDAARLVRIIAPAARRPAPGRVTDADLIAYASAMKPGALAWLEILTDTAMRSGELCALTWSDVDLTSKTILIRARKNPIRPTDQVIPMLGRSAQRFTELRSQPRPCPMPQATLSAMYSRATGRAQRLHGLRHEGITRLFERGWTIPQVAAVSGHSDWRQLRRYTHPTPQQLLELAS